MSRSRLTVRTIGQVVADYYGVGWNDISSARRTRHVVRPRQVTMWAVRQNTPLSLPEIGRRCGGRDHTTVLHACRKIDELRGTDAAIDRELREVEGLLADREAMLVQGLIAPDPDIDPFVIAELILSGSPSEWGLTTPEVRALAQAVILRKPPEEEVEEVEKTAPASTETAPATPSPVEGVLKAYHALEGARFSARERAAREALERSLSALSDHFNHEPKGNSKWNAKLSQPRPPRLDRTMIARAPSS